MQGTNAGRFQLLGVAALLLVFVIVQVALAGRPGSDQRAQKSASLKSQVNKLKQRVAALEKKPDQVGQAPAIPGTLPPSGPAGGELAGSYPSPQIGTVAGLDLATSTAPTGGINFGPDTNLFRNGTDSLSTSDTLIVGGNLGVDGPLGAFISGGVSTETLTVPELPSVMPTTNQAILYADDNGANKTRLRVQFPTGAPVTLATEP